MTAPLEPQWYVARDGKRFGPMSDADFRNFAAEGQVREDDYVWRQGFDDWVFARNVPGLLPAQMINDDPTLSSTSDFSLDHAITEPVITNTTTSFEQPSPSYDAPSFAEQSVERASPVQDPHFSEPWMSVHPNMGAQQEPQMSPGVASTPSSPISPDNTQGDPAQNNWSPDPMPNWPHQEPSHATWEQPHPNPSDWASEQNSGPSLSVSSADQQTDASFLQGHPSGNFDRQEPQFADNFTMTADMPIDGQARRGGGFRKIAFTGAIILFILIISAVALPFVVPADAIRDQVVKLIKEKTGRDVTIRGRTSVAFFPNIGVKLTDITLSNPPGMAGEPMLRMAALTVDLKLLPLLAQEVELDRFVLKNPRLSLFVDRSGRKNWEFNTGKTIQGKVDSRLPSATENTQITGFSTTVHGVNTNAAALDTAMVYTPTKIAQGPSLESSPPSSQAASNILRGLSLGDMRIIDGTLHYENLQDGSLQNVEKINVAIEMKTLEKPLKVKGHLEWRGETISLDTNLKTPGALLSNGSSPLEFEVKSAPVEARFSGQMVNQQTPLIDGNISGKANSLNRLITWTSEASPLQGGNEPLSLKGRLFASAEKIGVQQTNIAHAGAKAEGDASVTLTGARPLIQATLKIDHLNVNNYLPVEGKSAPAKKQAVAAAPPPPVAEPQSLTALINQVNVDQETTPSNAASAAIAPVSTTNSLSALGAADADVQFTANKLTYKKITTGKADAIIALRNGKMTADLKRTALYGGAASGGFTIDSASAGNPFKSSWKIEGVSALPFLRDAAKLDLVSGKANISLDLTGSGLEHKQIVRSLSGSGAVTFEDGAIEGVNIPGMIRNIQQGQLSGLSRTSSEKTDFSQFSGTFTIDKGVATNKDLALISPLLRMSGAGSADLAEETIDYRVQPKIVASLEGQGATVQGLDGIAIPVRLKGPWEKPQITPDTEQLLKDPNKIVQGVKQIGKLFKSKNKSGGGGDFESIISNVLTPKKSASQETSSTNQPDQKQMQAIETNKLLKQLLAQ